MNYVYHGVPENMIGNTLMPLNKLQELNSELKAQYLEKYQGREEIMERRIPLLNCLWNDVVQFLPMHPQTVFNLQKDMHIIPVVEAYKFYEIPLDNLDSNKTVVFFKTAPGEENTEVKWLNDVDWHSLQTIPPATIEYYKTLVGTGELPFNYQFIPHIVSMDTIDVSQAKIVTLCNPTIS